MGKYLQNIEFRHDPLVKKKGLLGDAQMISRDLSLIEKYFNKCLPKKIEIGNNIWRFIIALTPIKEKNGFTEVVGLCQVYFNFIDYKKVLELQSIERQKMFLEIFIYGIEKCCEVNKYESDIFRNLYKKVQNELQTKSI